MGNVLVSPCFQQISCSSSRSPVKLMFWDGTVRMLTGRHIAGEIMFEHPDKMVCHADSFFIGLPIPALSIEDHLLPGHTYFVLPLDCFSCNVLSASSLAALSNSCSSSSSSPSPKPALINFGECPFEYIKGANGRVLIKVVPEFMIRIINRGNEESIITPGGSSSLSNRSFLCSTPELKKHYDQLVGSRDQTWSPKLETISEYKIRYSPCRFLGLEWKQQEKDA